MFGPKDLFGANWGFDGAIFNLFAFLFIILICTIDLLYEFFVLGEFQGLDVKAGLGLVFLINGDGEHFGDDVWIRKEVLWLAVEISSEQMGFYLNLYYEDYTSL